MQARAPPSAVLRAEGAGRPGRPPGPASVFWAGLPGRPLPHEQPLVVPQEGHT